MSTRKYNAISSFEMKGSNRDHSGQSIDEYQYSPDDTRLTYKSFSLILGANTCEQCPKAMTSSLTFEDNWSPDSTAFVSASELLFLWDTGVGATKVIL